MKHLILVIAILTAVAAQAQQPGNCLKLKKVKIDHHMLHQQDETVAQLTFKARNCSLLTGREKPDFTFADEPGLFVGVKDIRFSETDENAAGRTKEMSVSVKLIASVALPVGEHELRGIVKYHVVSSAGTITQESLAIAIPFKVAPPKPPQNEFVEGLKTTREVLAGIALFPVFLAVTLIYCPISGECPTC